MATTEREIAMIHVMKLLHEIVRPLTRPDRHPLDVSRHDVAGEPIPYAEAVAAPYEPCQVGCQWGPTWATTWFHFAGRVPQEWKGSEVVASIDLGGYAFAVGFCGEGLVWQDGEPVTGLNPKHKEHIVARTAAGGEDVDFLVEAAGNPVPPWGRLKWPLLMPDYQGWPLYRLNRAELARVDGELDAAHRDLRALFDLASALGPESPRAIEIMHALAKVARAVDLDGVRDSLLAARPIWQEVLAVPAAAGAHRVTAVGHAHIDTAWLWPLRETIRKCARTFASATALMDGYPEYRFVCSQAQQHDWMREHYPTLFAQMRERAAEGRFEPVGSMWVEPDTNLPSGESLVRQLVHGKRFFAEHYGVDTVDLWLPDAFGYSGALPQVLRQAGVRFFFTQKLSWNEIDRFPHHTFWWEGIDGSRVLAHCPPTDTYNGELTPEELLKGVQAFAQHGASRHSLYVYGWGDGGGGPTADMLEKAKRYADTSGLPQVTLGNARGFFETIEAEPDADALPVWSGELYLERHRATYTTQSSVKEGNRRCEDALREAEMWSVAAVHAVDYPAIELREAWRKVLLHQFHDILPGSSIHWVHQDTRRDHAEVRATAQAIIERAATALAAAVDTAGTAHPVVVLNPGSQPRTGVVEVDLAALGSGEVPTCAIGAGGETSPVQDLGNGTAIFLATVPGCGWARYDLAAERGTAAHSHEAALPAQAESGHVLTNGIVAVEIDEDGLVGSVRDLARNREALAPGARGNLFQLHHDLPNDTDAWDVDPYTFDSVTDLTGGVESIDVVEDGPVRAAIKVVRTFGASRIDQTVRLAAGSPVVEFVTSVDWHEEHKFLKVAFPVAVHAQQATYEIAFGNLQRPTHANTTWDRARFEVCAHRYADLSEAGFGVALINDCKYGYDVRRNVMRLSLLRAPGWPDPEADRGEQRFSYALFPHAAALADSRVAEQAEAFNMPLRAVATSVHEGSLAATGSVLSVSRPGVLVSAIKLAEDGGSAVVARLWEVYGGRGPVRVTLAALANGPAGAAGATPAEVHRCDLLEREGEPCALGGRTASVDVRPYEIVSLRFTPSPIGG